MRSLSLRHRLFLVTGLALLPALVVVGTSVELLDDVQKRDVSLQAQRSAELMALELERIISGTENVLTMVASSPAELRGDRASCSAFLARAVAALPALESIAVIRPDGLLWCVPDLPETEFYLDDRSYFIEASSAQFRVVGVYLEDRITGQTVLPIALPHRDNAGVLIEVLVGYIDLAWLQERVEDRTYTPGSALTIADRDGRILARYPEPGRFVGTLIPEAFQRLVNAEAPGTEEVISQDGTPRRIGYVPVNAGPNGLYVSVGFATEPAEEIVRSLATSGALILISGMMITVVLARYIARHFITRPFAKILQTIQFWRTGQTDSRTKMNPRQGEIGEIGYALDGFMDELIASRNERQKLDTQRRLMMRELDHRVKNLLGLIRAVARQTFAGQVTPNAMETFSGRLQSIGAANSLLLEEKWQGADIRAVIEAAIQPFQPKDGTQFNLAGPSILCNSAASVAFSMAIHELCTNAAKYGALSVPTGQIYVIWKETDGLFELQWLEKGGPPVAKPNSTGFGSTVINRILASQIGGKVDMHFFATGLTCRVTCPTASMQGEPRSAELPEPAPYTDAKAKLA